MKIVRNLAQFNRMSTNVKFAGKQIPIFYAIWFTVVYLW